MEGVKMKKKAKIMAIIMSTVLILSIGVLVIYFLPIFLMLSPKGGYIPDTNIYVAKDRGGAYFVKTNDGYIMIDAGLNIKNIENSLKKANINTNDVKCILLTHSDGDHVAGLTLFPKANIYMSKDELPMINGTIRKSFFGYNSLPDGINTDEIITLSNGQELLLNGTKINCISAPGHTTGLMMYLVDARYLFSGDA
jgi:glyoxylase-like metal-dependent hydrolase (beta-lactamase superfamily II)